MKVKEYKFGNTKIEAFDDAIREEKEVKESLERVGKIENKKKVKYKKASA